LDWIDLALVGDEAALDDAIRNLDSDARQEALTSLARELELEGDEVERAVLRMMVERVRPLALPRSLWARPITASDEPESHVRAHFQRKRINPTPQRLRQATQLYAQFADERDRVSVTEASLKTCGYRCEHCGLAFHDEELQKKALVSPFGTRGSPKHDPWKPQWHQHDLRYPTMDHHWPVSLYGDNRAGNMKVLCRGCNLGKEHYVALEQYRSTVGLPARSQLIGAGPVACEVFYAQLRRAPACVETGQIAKDVELTVRLKDPHAAAVLDNLETVVSSD